MCTSGNQHAGASPATAAATAANAACKVVKTTLPIDELLPVPGSRALVARCADALYLVDGQAVQRAAEQGRSLDFADQDACRLIASDVHGTVSLNAANKTIVYIKDERVIAQTLGDDPRPRRLPVPSLDHPVTAAHLSDDAAQLLCIVRDDSDIDFSHYSVVSVELESRTATNVNDISSVRELKAFWSPSAAAFLVFDDYVEALWRIEPAGRTPQRIDLPAAEGRSFVGIVAHPSEAWVALVVQDAASNSRYLMQGAVNHHVRWEGIARLSGGIPSGFCWHPTDRTLLYERSIRRRSLLEVITTVGMSTATGELPRGWVANDLAWSADGRIVYAAGSTGLVVWRPLETKEG